MSTTMNLKVSQGPMPQSTSKSSPLISIIIPFYNHNAYIKETLDSIIADTYPNKEILLINDGSTDPDDSAITLWEKAHPQIAFTYIKRENQGVTKTLNELISYAKGTFILPCASDDYLINNTLKERVDLLLQNPQKPVILGDCKVVDRHGEPMYASSLFELYAGKIENYRSPKGLLKEVVTRWALAGPQDIMYKSVFDDIGLYDETLCVEDWDFYLRATRANKVQFYASKPVAAYRRHQTNTTTEINLFDDLAKTALRHFLSMPYPLNFALLKLALKNWYWAWHFKRKQ